MRNFEEKGIKEVGAQIKKICAMKCISYQNLSEKAGVSLSALYNIFSGCANPRFSTLMLISCALDVPIEILFRTSDDNVQIELDIDDLVRDYQHFTKEKKELLHIFLRALNTYSSL